MMFQQISLQQSLAVTVSVGGPPDMNVTLPSNVSGFDPDVQITQENAPPGDCWKKSVNGVVVHAFTPSELLTCIIIPQRSYLSYVTQIWKLQQNISWGGVLEMCLFIIFG